MILMAWRYEDDASQRRIAADIQRHVGPQWLVFWGPASRKFWAFLCDGPYPLMLGQPNPQELYDLIRHHHQR